MKRIDHAEASSKFIKATDHLDFHDKRLWDLRKKRDRESEALPEWQELRSLASAIKEHTLSHLADYLLEFERNAIKNGAQVHWAKDAAEHNQVVYDILHARGVRTLVKAKSMLTDECEMRPFLENRGIEVMETDLGERIQQLDDEPPSHIVVPAVHKLRGDVARVFSETIGTDPKNSDVHYLAESQRQHTRPYFLRAEAGMTGANFAVAETGTVVVCTNEGNADLSVHLPNSTSPASASRRSFPASSTSACSCGCCRAARWARRSPSSRPTSARRARAAGDAHRAGRQRPVRASRHGGLLVFAQVHPLRRLHEHVPRVPAQRGPELWRDLLGPDRGDHRSHVQPAQVQRAAVRLDAQRELHQRLPGEDQHPRADLQVARDHRRTPPAALRQAGGDAGRGQGAVEPEALPRRGRGGGRRASSICRAS